MLIYASLALNFYIRMLYFIYKKRGDYDGLPEIKEVRAQKAQEAKAQQAKLDKKASQLSQKRNQ